MVVNRSESLQNLLTFELVMRGRVVQPRFKAKFSQVLLVQECIEFFGMVQKEKSTTTFRHWQWLAMTKFFKLHLSLVLLQLWFAWEVLHLYSCSLSTQRVLACILSNQSHIPSYHSKLVMAIAPNLRHLHFSHFKGAEIKTSRLVHPVSKQWKSLLSSPSLMCKRRRRVLQWVLHWRIEPKLH